MALIEVELTRVMLVETSDQQVVVLQEKDGERSFPIVIGIFEAVAIHRVLRQEEAPRPMTHDLLVNLIDALGGKVQKLVVRDIVDGTFLGSLMIETRDGVKEVDCRPSDGLSVAVRTSCPILVDERVFKAME
ncbi:MAG TPA: bifunctional nuclease family protein [Planctomycetes bacterium]|nr:bifunctional nuclease family protein [Planctomycetota bacterium]